MIVRVSPHPNLRSFVFVSTFKDQIEKLKTPKIVLDALTKDYGSPVASSDEIRKQVRDLIRHNGYKPTGRGKPASEYLFKMGNENELRSINLPVDICNAVSFHSGLPISVIDIDKAEDPFSIKCAEPESSYIFNPAGQEIKISGLLCLHDKAGPCANAVKDAQRTKTSASTKRTLSVVWGIESEEAHSRKTFEWYTDLLSQSDAEIEMVTLDEARED